MLVNGGQNAIPPVGGDGGPDGSSKTETRRKPKTSDAVEISAKARNLSANETSVHKAVSGGQDMKVGVARVRTEIRERLRSGFYESEGVLTEIANRILDLLGF